MKKNQGKEKIEIIAMSHFRELTDQCNGVYCHRSGKSVSIS